MPAPTTISTSRTRPVPCVPKYYRRPLQICIWTGSSKQAKNIQSDINNNLFNCLGGFKFQRKCYKSLPFANTMNLLQSPTYLKTCFLLCFSRITIIFCSGDPLEYENLMTRMAVLFICWWRRHYNKPTLSFRSDMEYHKNVPARILVKEVGAFQSNYREKGGSIPFFFTRAQYGTWWWQFFVSNCKSHSSLFLFVNIQGMLFSLLSKRCFWH